MVKQKQAEETTAYPYLLLEHADRMPGSSQAVETICRAKGVSGKDHADGWRLYLLERVH